MNEVETDGSRILMLEGDFILLHSLGLKGVEKPLLLVKILFTIQEMLPL